VDDEIASPEAAEALPNTPAGARSLTRRALLKRLTAGAGVVAVVAAGGATWRAVDQGVFIPGTGPAYDPWRADLRSRDPMRLVAAGILAANAHDSQPWAFRVGADRIDLFADTGRSMGAMDPLQREMYISVGCALENLVLAAKANGWAAKVHLFPDAADPTHAATVELGRSVAEASDLFAAIPTRHTNRAAYRTDRAVSPELLDEVAALADAPDVSLMWFATEDAKSHFAQLTIDATAAIIADPEQARDDFAWYRQDWTEIQRRRDGITLDAGGLGEMLRILVRLLPPSDRAAMDQGWLDATRDRQVSTAAAFGLILVRDAADPCQRVLAGRFLQRVHLFATTKDLALQPLNQIFERADQELNQGLEPTLGRAVDQLTPSGRHALTAFRIGYPTAAPALSPRRPVEAVLRP
jgi:nitroreductase